MDSKVFDDLVLPRKFLRMCRRNLRRTKIVRFQRDGTHRRGLAYRHAGLETAAAAGSAGRATRPTWAFCLPPSVGAVLSNAALTIDRRIAVNLNYTVTSELINASMAQCGIRHVLTSRRMLDRFPLKLDAELVYVEELKRSHDLVRQAAGRRGRLAAAGRGPGTPAGPHRGPARRRGDGHVHVRLDRPAQGRDADVRQHRREPARNRQRHPLAPQRCPAGRAADVPLLRLHGHALDGADARLPRAFTITRRWNRGRSARSAASTAARS